jgi:epoxyqueuosine reductase
MFAFLSKILQKNNIDLLSPLPLSECRVVKPYLLERAGITDGTAFLMAVPYFSHACLSPDRNVSAYAVSRDYHVFFQKLFEDVLPLLRKEYPQNRFAGFADHSPIAEVEAAARAGLGVIGLNNLLITEKYSSYVFLATLITDAIIPCEPREINHCIECGACRQQCPAKDEGICLSALTQKKGALTENEQKAILAASMAWGCDICQEVCPHTKKAIAQKTIFSPVPFFHDSPIPHLSLEALQGMSEEAFSQRAYAWRKRETVERNLKLLEKQGKEKQSCSD